jgi:hypothetical protein
LVEESNGTPATFRSTVGDFIIWQDEAVEVEGQPAVVSPA